MVGPRRQNVPLLNYMSKTKEHLIDAQEEGGSICCDAPVMGGFCQACHEHSDAEDIATDLKIDQMKEEKTFN